MFKIQFKEDEIQISNTNLKEKLIHSKLWYNKWITLDIIFYLLILRNGDIITLAKQ